MSDCCVKIFIQVNASCLKGGCLQDCKSSTFKGSFNIQIPWLKPKLKDHLPPHFFLLFTGVIRFSLEDSRKQNTS